MSTRSGDQRFGRRPSRAPTVDTVAPDPEDSRARTAVDVPATTADTAPLHVVDPVVPTVDRVLDGAPATTDRTLADAPALIAELVAAGHPARWTATPEVAGIDPEVSRAAYGIMEASTGVICRFLPAGQNLVLRGRVDGSDLVLSVQSSGLEGLGQRGLVPESERAAVRARVHAARGRLALRRTASGNWLGVVTLPL